jgi:D-serine dehydratase
MDLSSIDRTLLDHRVKGMPGGVVPFPLGQIGAKRWNVLAEDLPLPLAVIKESALAHNGAWMRRFVDLSGAKIAPHGKTTMSPQLFARQLADGAWAMTVATVQQLQVARDFGVPRIVLANQLVGRQAIGYVVAELPVGDMVGFGISHPCLTFDKWQVLCLVDDDYTVTGAVKTFF